MSRAIYGQSTIVEDYFVFNYMVYKYIIKEGDLLKGLLDHGT
jgi:hypothetical protein